MPPLTLTDFRIINTQDAHIGPRGVRYVHDAARPFAVLFNSNRGEICSARCATEERAKIVMAGFIAARARYAARNVQVA
jgi:hypothetical protein